MFTVDIAVGSSELFPDHLSIHKVDQRKHLRMKKKAAGTLSLGLDPRFTFDNFVVGKPNELAYAAAQRVAESTEVVLTPCFIRRGWVG